MWIYSQSSGKLKRDGNLISVGYSGFGEGKNNPSMQQVADVGPIPQGLYEISAPYDTTTHGPLVMALIPQPGTNTFGRSGFLIHGDSIEHPGQASHGCIIMNKVVRLMIGGSGDHWLTVCE
jgi:Tlde1 domain